MGGVRCLGLFPKKNRFFFGCLPLAVYEREPLKIFLGLFLFLSSGSAHSILAGQQPWDPEIRLALIYTQIEMNFKNQFD